MWIISRAHRSDVDQAEQIAVPTHLQNSVILDAERKSLRICGNIVVFRTEGGGQTVRVIRGGRARVGRQSVADARIHWASVGESPECRRCTRSLDVGRRA